MNETISISPALLEQIQQEPEYVWRLGMDVISTRPELFILQPPVREAVSCISEQAAWKQREHFIRHGITPTRDAPYKMLKGEFIRWSHANRRIALVIDEDFQIVERYDP